MFLQKIICSTVRAQIYTCSFVFLGEYFLKCSLLQLQLEISEELIFIQSSLSRENVPSQEAIQLPFLFSGESI